MKMSAILQWKIFKSYQFDFLNWHQKFGQRLSLVIECAPCEQSNTQTRCEPVVTLTFTGRCDPFAQVLGKCLNKLS